MAHVGKIFPYLKRRDLGRLSGIMSSLAEQLRWQPFLSGGGTLTVGWATQISTSDEGVVDASAGRVLYIFPPPSLAPPTTELHMEWRLTFDELMWEWWVGFYNNGTLMGYREHIRISCNEHRCEPRNPWQGIVDFAQFHGLGAGFADAEPWPP